MEQRTEFVKQVLADLLQHMGISAEIETEVSEGILVFNLKTPDSGILIGQHGACLAALQYMTRTLVHKKMPEAVHFILDVEGYKKTREDFLRELARQAATRVRETKEALLLKPMLAYERRVIHTEISKFSDIATESSGEEPERRIKIMPRD